MLASLALHVLLFYALPAFREARRQLPPKPLTARLVEQKAPAPLPATPAPPKAEPLLQPRVQPQPRPAPAPRPAPVLTTEAPKAVVEAPVIVPPPVPTPAPPAAAPAPPAPKMEARSVPSAQPAEADSLAQYRMEIIELARRYKRYPRIAQDNNWTGTSSVRLVIGADGGIESLIVRTSSGYAVLDQEALAMLRTAKSKATIPPALRGKTITLDVPVIFNMKDE